jgi:hypothetical protein
MDLPALAATSRRLQHLSEAVDNYYDRLDANHVDDEYCPDDQPCERCAPLLAAAEDRTREIEETAASLPGWLRVLAKTMFAVFHPVEAFCATIEYLRRRR